MSSRKRKRRGSKQYPGVGFAYGGGSVPVVRVRETIRESIPTAYVNVSNPITLSNSQQQQQQFGSLSNVNPVNITPSMTVTTDINPDFFNLSSSSSDGTGGAGSVTPDGDSLTNGDSSEERSHGAGRQEVTVVGNETEVTPPPTTIPVSPIDAIKQNLLSPDNLSKETINKAVVGIATESPSIIASAAKDAVTEVAGSTSREIRPNKRPRGKPNKEIILTEDGASSTSEVQKGKFNSLVNNLPDKPNVPSESIDEFLVTTRKHEGLRNPYGLFADQEDALTKAVSDLAHFTPELSEWYANAKEQMENIGETWTLSDAAIMIANTKYDGDVDVPIDNWLEVTVPDFGYSTSKALENYLT